ncbi:hypothetical protein D3H55_19675 [Bacillus salacetis]|uniref:Uncharacterized protein n=1 Tax=Bacillus salacetis TaxID=2315464 RepID=A0A3A1QQ54_9BACI|nr:hypothetical protein [Bacillus salacetis]RIW29215.1 hypothetical protein D3H55_19675 [Bacillus salacetis]
MTSKENKIAAALYVVGALSIIVGAISGLYYGSQGDAGGFGESNARIAWGVFIDGLVWGIVFFGFAEVIKLLQGIYNQGEQGRGKPAAGVPSDSDPDSKTGGGAYSESVKEGPQKEISEIERGQIEGFYAGKGFTVENIAVTEREDCFVVTVNGKKEVVELGGFKPIVHPYKVN